MCHLEVVQLLCDSGADKDKVDKRRFTALMRASRESGLEVVRLLFEAGADKDKVAESGLTPLMLASGHGHLEVARLLCEAGAEKDKADDSGDTALMRACYRGQLEVVRLLCEAGADRDRGAPIRPPLWKYVEVYGVRTTALRLASERGHQDTADLLLEPLAKRPRYEGGDMTARSP